MSGPNRIGHPPLAPRRTRAIDYIACTLWWFVWIGVIILVETSQR
jgi:hypothetical protein